MKPRRIDTDCPAWGGSALPALAGVDGVYLQRMDLSPMIGVVFTLLLILMVMTPATTGGPYLPSAASAELIPTGRARVWVGPGGRLFAGDPLREISTSALRDVMNTALAASPEPRVVYVTADWSTPYGRMLDVMDAARAAHVRRLGLIPILPHRPGRARER
ncbi:MAG TPA: biopolymer transporter ExbD [Longimicrobiaceae bacterium]|nr:biopolymer transporter ExbD [Longimicrobiaceae bacterium]